MINNKQLSVQSNNMSNDTYSAYVSIKHDFQLLITIFYNMKVTIIRSQWIYLQNVQVEVKIR